MLEKYRGVETVLLVDDEPVVLKLARSILNHCGYRVIDFSDPAGALKRVCEESVDIILTDVVMPGISGPELIRQVKETNPNIPCIFMSGYDMHQIAERGMSAGCDYLRKPFTPEGLLKRVRSSLDERDATRE